MILPQQIGVIHIGMGFWIQNLNQRIQHQILFGLNLWANSADKEMAQNKYNNSDLPSTTLIAFTCNNVDFSGVAIRR